MLMMGERSTAQLIGHEFVRQYYTSLHKEPHNLYKYYGTNSSYVHGGLDGNGKPLQPVYGQSNIQEKVMSLGFRECVAKIMHMDSHTLPNNNVVVQVMGELSNNKQPMRKFVQTFVLAHTVAFKWYVHNDVFRYQDEVFRDSDSESPKRCDSDPEAYKRSEAEAAVATASCEPETEHVKYEIKADVLLEPEPVEDPTESPIIPIAALTEELAASDDPPSTASADATLFVPEENNSETSEAEMEQMDERVPSPEDDSIEIYNQRPWSEQDQCDEEEDQATMSANLVPEEEAQKEAELAVMEKADSDVPSPVSGSTMTSKNLAVKSTAQRTGGPPPTHKGPRPVREVRYPDNHQIFVGNIPRYVDEAELNKVFEQYGTVLNLSIKNGGKSNCGNYGKGGGNCGNFGFVAFNDSAPVQTILSNKPIKVRGDWTLNVEEMKARPPRSPRNTHHKTATTASGEVKSTTRRPGGPPPVHSAHQLFVGSIPHNVEDAELKEFFEQYGTVLKLSIKKGGKLPNFAFVSFNDSAPVQNILSKGYLLFRGEVRLNVEEMKARPPRPYKAASGAVKSTAQRPGHKGPSDLPLNVDMKREMRTNGMNPRQQSTG